MHSEEYSTFERFCAAIDDTGQQRIKLAWQGWDATIDMKLADINPAEVIPFGTRELVSYGISLGWKIFWNEEYSYASLLAFGLDFVNHDMVVGPLDRLMTTEAAKTIIYQLRKGQESVFVREVAGFNIIKGKVINCYSPGWQNGLKVEGREYPQQYKDWHPITGTSLFAMAPVKKIHDEYRVWIINNKAVTGSAYILGGEITGQNIDDSDSDGVMSYAERQAARKLLGMDNYVLDIFRTDEGLKVGEVNSIHCAGFYDVKPEKIVEALWRQGTNYGAFRPGFHPRSA